MDRIIDKQLLEWADHSDRKPLIVRGARQVGKTWSVGLLGERRFKGRIHRVDFERNPDWHKIFSENLDVFRILSELEIVLNTRIVPGDDLLFLDEIQSCPRALMSLRYFYEEMPGLHVVAAGSLLEFALEGISFPVGRIQFLEMHPLTFREFLLATDNSNLAEVLRDSPKLISETVHGLLMSQLRKYFLVGGMPEAVACFSSTKSLEAAFRIQDDLIEAYRQDFSKYAPRADKLCLASVLTQGAKSVGRVLKYAGLAEGFSIPTIHRAYDLLCMAKVLSKVRSTSPAGLPLSASASEKRFKSLVLDVGLMRSLAEVSAKEIIATSDLLGIYNGALAEQFVGQELRAATGRVPFYWQREAKNSQAEVDYLVAVDGDVVPVEVKSGTAGRLKSLHMLLENYQNCERGYVLSDRPFGEIVEQKLVFLPLYYAGSFGEHSHFKV